MEPKGVATEVWWRAFMDSQPCSECDGEGVVPANADTTSGPVMTCPVCLGSCVQPAEAAPVEETPSV